MSARRHEEILEECLSAYLEGRRSVEESLSLYPSYADELEPLLHAATHFNKALNTQSPSASVLDRGLQRFLSDAQSRRSLAALRLDEGPHRVPVWHRYRFALAAAGMAVLLVAIELIRS